MLHYTSIATIDISYVSTLETCEFDAFSYDASLIQNTNQINDWL